MTLFIDFDGTIIENKQRYYRVHVHCLESSPVILSQDEYWKLKCSRVSEREILADHYPNVDVNQYQSKRNSIIESLEFLAFDRLLPLARETLKVLSKKHALILLTLRKNEKNTLEEIRTLGLENMWKDIRIASAGSDPIATKIALLDGALPAQDWVIGDTEADILAGKKMGLTTCAVLSGIRDEPFLASLQPTHLIRSITDLPSLLR